MELAQLRFFVTLAEELACTPSPDRSAAAARSRPVRALERQLGTLLFSGDRWDVELTEAGRAFLEPARRTLARADEAIASVRATRQAVEGALTVGVLAHGAAELTLPIFQAFRTANPHVDLRIRELAFDDQVAAVTEHRVDVAIVRPPLADPRLEVEALAVEPRVALLPAGHPLAEAPVVPISAILEDRFLVAPPSPPEWRDFWLATDRRGGIPARTDRTEVRTMFEACARVALDEVVATAPASSARYFPLPGVVYVPLTGLSGSEVALARPYGPPAPLVERFGESARAITRSLIELLPDARSLVPDTTSP